MPVWNNSKPHNNARSLPTSNASRNYLIRGLCHLRSPGQESLRGSAPEADFQRFNETDSCRHWDSKVLCWLDHKGALKMPSECWANKITYRLQRFVTVWRLGCQPTRNVITKHLFCSSFRVCLRRHKVMRRGIPPRTEKICQVTSKEFPLHAVDSKALLCLRNSKRQKSVTNVSGDKGVLKDLTSQRQFSNQKVNPAP